MSKSRRNRKTRTPPTPREKNTPAPPSQSAAEPTAKQSARLEEAEAQVGALTAELGSPPARSELTASGASLVEVLRRAERVLADATSHLGSASKREAAAKAAQTSLTLQTKALEQSEEDRRRRIEACDAGERAVEEREGELRAKEAELADHEARLSERELNAERGFLTEKTRVLKPLEEEIEELRRQRDALETELRGRRSQADEEARSKAKERSEAWAKEEQRRTASEAGARRAFDAEMASVRRDELAKLRATLQGERKNADAKWERELAARQAGLEARESEMDTREGDLLEKAKGLRRHELDLQAEQEMLAEDKAALGRKVERLVAESTEDLRHQVPALTQQLEDARSRRDAYFSDIESRRELDRRFGDRTPEQILADLTSLERERDEAAEQLRLRPDAGAAERLAELERERSGWLERRAVLEADLARSRGELATRRLAAIELEALRKQKEALEVHKQLLDGAVEELRARVDELTRQDEHRNPMTALSSLDDEEKLQNQVRTTSPTGRAMPTLREFTTDLRHRIARGVQDRTLYYTERDIRSFLGGLAMTRLLLLQGISGTGKTSLPLAFASAVGGGIEVVEVQAGWRDRQDLIGYYNAFHRHYYATNFLQALYKAGTPAYHDRLFLMVLDEINLSRPEQFFADFLSALEQPMGARRLTLVNDPVSNAPRLMGDGRHLSIPPNVWFIGTANHDETTTEFADKTYDRAHVMEMPRKTEAAHFDVEDKRQRNPLSYEKLEVLFGDASNKHASAVAKATTWLRDAPFAESLGRRFRVGWGNRLEHQLGRYLPVVVEAGGTVGEAMDHLLHTKVLRKLKDRHDVRATALEDLQEQLLTAWEELDSANPPERCDALIQTEIDAKKGEELV